jgi:hypothetical protein
MKRYLAFDPNNEIIGQSLIAIANAIGSEEFIDIFIQHHLTNVDPTQWYPEQQFLDVLSDIAERGGGMFDFVSIGMNMIANGVFPPALDTMPFEQIISNSAAFALNTRGPKPKSMKIDVLGPKHIVRRYIAPEPDDYWYGVAYGYAKRFLAPGVKFRVYYDPNVPRRDNGGEETLVHIEWE